MTLDNQSNMSGPVGDPAGATRQFHETMVTRTRMAERERHGHPLSGRFGWPGWRAWAGDFLAGLATFAGGSVFGAGALLAIRAGTLEGEAAVFSGSGLAFVLATILIRRLVALTSAPAEHAARS